MPRHGPSNAATRPWTHLDVAIPWRGRRGPADSAVHPIGHRSERVVVERGHLAGVDRPVREHAVPAFPDGRGTHGHGVEPRGIFTLKEQPEGGSIIPRAA